MTLLSKLRENPSYYDQVKWAYTKGQVDDTEYLERAMTTITDYFKDDQHRVDNKYRPHSLLTRWDIEDEVFNCDDCESLEYTDSGGTVYNDGLVCECCLDRNYTYSEYQDTYISHDDYQDEMHEEGQREDEYIYEWDYDVASELGNQFLYDEDREKTITYGIELEVERRRNADDNIAEQIHDSVYDFARLKSDGSLSNGFEIVTAPCSFEYQKNAWSKFLKSDLTKQIRGWKTDTAGLHIHIGKKQLQPSEIGKILIFINSDENNQFVDDIAGRSSDQWAKKYPKKITDSLYRTSRDDRYEAVNMSNQHTIELRIFKSNLAHNGFMRVLEFADALVHFAKQTGLSGMSLHYKSFLRFMEKPENRTTYPIFYAWLCHRKYSGGRASRKVAQEELSLQENAV